MQQTSPVRRMARDHASRRRAIKYQLAHSKCTRPAAEQKPPSAQRWRVGDQPVSARRPAGEIPTTKYRCSRTGRPHPGIAHEPPTHQRQRAALTQPAQKSGRPRREMTYSPKVPACHQVNGPRPNRQPGHIIRSHFDDRRRGSHPLLDSRRDQQVESAPSLHTTQCTSFPRNGRTTKSPGRTPPTKATSHRGPNPAATDHRLPKESPTASPAPPAGSPTGAAGSHRHQNPTAPEAGAQPPDHRSRRRRLNDGAESHRSACRPRPDAERPGPAEPTPPRSDPAAGSPPPRSP